VLVVGIGVRKQRKVASLGMNAALDLGLACEAITPGRLRAEEVTTLQASYVAAILRAIAP